MIGNYVEIELSADHMYYTIIGEEQDMYSLLSKIKDTDREYIITKLYTPIANVSPFGYMIDNYMEQIQCSLLCDCNSKEEKKAYALMCIDKNNGMNVLRYMCVDTEENSDPETLIKNEINKMLKGSDTKSIIKSARLVDIINLKSSTLVYLLRCNKV